MLSRPISSHPSNVIQLDSVRDMVDKGVEREEAVSYYEFTMGSIHLTKGFRLHG
jgi:hypothetical protein